MSENKPIFYHIKTQNSSLSNYYESIPQNTQQQQHPADKKLLDCKNHEPSFYEKVMSYLKGNNK